MEAYNVRLAIQQKLINTHNEELLTKPGLFHFICNLQLESILFLHLEGK